MYTVHRFVLMTLDPVHIGTGGYRLGRVDLSIVREPGTNLPKIPGTSLSGACRTYAAMQEDGKFPNCAGQGQPDTNRGYQGHCGQPDCPICVTFGFAKGSGASFQGLAQFSDARLLFFPVHSLAGPVWVTCPMVLKDVGISEVEPQDGQVHVASGVKVSKRLNLGWLMLEVAGNDFAPEASQLPGISQDILHHAVLVSNKMFGHIVNDNLEVRTSVSIDPSTGAVAEGALFTYEAIPRASVLYFEVVVSHPKYYRIARTVERDGKKQTEYVIPLSDEEHPEGNLDKVKETVRNGLKLLEFLGAGGMNTRGMGRLRVLNLNEGGAQ
ncbi:MAG: type III-B CRISPR module RAMP protein Cmr4 [Anaerolineae bacterium]